MVLVKLTAGGGLIAGCAQIVKLIDPKVTVIGVEMALAPAMKRSIEAGRIITLDKIPIIIDGLAVKTVGEYNFLVLNRLSRLERRPFASTHFLNHVAVGEWFNFPLVFKSYFSYF